MHNSVPGSPEAKASPASAGGSLADDDLRSSEPTSVQVAAEPSIGDVIVVDGEGAPSASTPSRTSAHVACRRSASARAKSKRITACVAPDTTRMKKCKAGNRSP
ncbi:hypothetical protein V7S43_003598 [Phytophthora oleae]|uniref:Uncharacterized protein n=1 Tax=Phytophthora oleae TaxID=2107226 RepID=A0ABD3FXP3_9STRA